MFESSDPKVIRTHQLEEELRKISNEDIQGRYSNGCITGEAGKVCTNLFGVRWV